MTTENKTHYVPTQDIIDNFLVGATYSAVDKTCIIRHIRSIVNLHEALLGSLQEMFYREQIKFVTTKNKCRCMQFEDNETCRHVRALNVISQAEAI